MITPARLRESMLATYFRLRVALVVLSVALPLICYVYWKRVGPGPDNLQLDSISAFYGTGGLVRDLFVGILWVVAASLVAYKGLTVVEDWLLNAAGVCAALIAVIPCDCWYADGRMHNPWHFTAAISFFVLMAIVVLLFGPMTVGLLKGRWKDFFTWVYYANGAALVGSILLVVALNKWLPHYTAYVFRIEWLGIWSFSAYWALKSWEYSKTDFERRVARGEVDYHPTRGFEPAAPSARPE